LDFYKQLEIKNKDCALMVEPIMVIMAYKKAEDIEEIPIEQKMLRMLIHIIRYPETQSYTPRALLKILNLG